MSIATLGGMIGPITADPALQREHQGHCRDRKREANVHPAGIALYRRVEKLGDVRESHDFVESAGDL